MGKTIQPFDTGVRIETLRMVGTAYSDVTVWFTKYMTSDTPAVLLTTDHQTFGREQLAIVSVNIDTTPDEGCIWFKNYSEGDGSLEQFEELGLLERTGRTETTGWVTVPEARFIGDLAAAFERFKEVAY